jgi:hypothetical protein
MNDFNELNYVGFDRIKGSIPFYGFTHFGIDINATLYDFVEENFEIYWFELKYI